MAGMNSQIHLTLDTYTHNKLREEAEKEDISVNELIRRKLADPATDAETILMRELEKIIKSKRIKK